MPFSIITLPSGLTGFTVLAAAMIALAAVVIGSKPRTKASVLFFGTIVWLVAWTAARYFGRLSADPDLAILFLRIDLVSTAFVAYFFYVFAYNFPTARPSSPLEQAMALPALIFSSLAFTDLVVSKVSYENGSFAYDFGWLYGLYATFLFLAIGGGIIHLARATRDARAEQRTQVSYVLVGLGLTAATSLVFSVLLEGRVPPEIVRFGLYGILFFVGFTTVAVVKHHLANIEVIAVESLVAGITIVLALETFLSATTTEFLFRAVFFWLVAVFGFLLIRSVLETARRRAEADVFRQQLDELQRRFRQLEKARSEFISIASHQLRTPLTIIRGYLSLVLEGSYEPVSEKTVGVLNQAYSQADGMLRLIDHLLSISNLESGTVVYERATVKIGDLVAGVFKEYEAAAAKKKIGFVLEAPAAANVTVNVDRAKMELVVRNLIDNAVKYTAKGEVRVAVLPRKKEVLVSVKDSGLGMTKDDVAQCFQKLSRGETVKGDFPIGTGLGLFISKKYVTAHKGKIWAKSDGPGRGSEFVFSLPVHLG